MTTQPNPIKAYKAFDENFKCRGFQFEVGKEYTHTGDVEPCRSGFHACTDPLDVLSYYPLIGSKFAEVEMYGDTKSHKDDTKIAASKIKIKAEISIGAFIKASIDCVFNGWHKEAIKNHNGKEIASGDSSKAASSGDYSKAASSGDYSKAASSGDSSTAASSGNSSTAASSGDYSKAASSGNSSTAASSGDYSKAASSGDSSTAASSGDYSKAASSGDYSKAASSGNSSKAETNGQKTVAAAIGENCHAKAEKGGLIVLIHYGKNNFPLSAKSAIAGKGKIKPDTWYKLNSKGNFTEVK